MTEEPYRWLEAIGNRREYIRDQLKGGTPVFAVSRPLNSSGAGLVQNPLVSPWDGTDTLTTLTVSLFAHLEMPSIFAIVSGYEIGAQNGGPSTP